ncbi:MAG: exosome complex protein Rrp42 [SAR324 cluster bacterium]|jgi:exosome complex component RRP42|nr:exosome complex protein Rrp42 [SAR324 cluster bacterium]
MSVTIIPNLEKKSTRELIKSGKRADGRAFDQFRPIKLTIGDYKRAEGSATCWLGQTMVASGIKIGKAVPYPDSPNMGVLTTNAELNASADPKFQPGPPSEVAIELARVVDRGIRESKCIDLEKLCITPGEETRIVCIDAYVLDNSGNYMDAASLAAVAALHNTVIEDFGPLPITKMPISNTFIKVDSDILLDPTVAEENVADARLTITVEENNNVCAMQKALGGAWSIEEIMKCVDIAITRAAEKRKIVQDALAQAKTSPQEAQPSAGKM